MVALAIDLRFLLFFLVALIAPRVHNWLGNAEGILVLLISQLLEVCMFESLGCRNTVVWIVDQQFHDEILSILAHMLNGILDASASLGRKVKLHVRRLLLKPVKQLLLRCS